MSQSLRIYVIWEHFETLFNAGSGSETGFLNSLLHVRNLATITAVISSDDVVPAGLGGKG